MLFINCADELFRPITTIQKEGCMVKEISWTAFGLSASDWHHIADARDILVVSFIFISFWIHTNLISRIPIRFNSTSHQRPRQCSGGSYLSLKTFNHCGRRNAMEQLALSGLWCTGMLSRMAWISWISIITSLTRNLPTFSHWVSYPYYYSTLLLLIIPTVLHP